ncbi:MAG: hypothetical protein D9V44_01685 [Actinobacteria bacterium]|nr:MAG: hypothetical protein D9V44_01685 [Actinomycetota bacterium]
MQAQRNRNTIVAVTGILAVVALVAGLVLIVNAEAGYACTSAAEFGWLAPLFAASIIGGLAWVLLSQDPRTPDDTESTPLAECPECGRSVLGQWRMCPYCGEMLDARYSNRVAATHGK